MSHLLRGGSRSYIAEPRLQAMLLCYVEDRIGILPVVLDCTL